MGTARRKVHGGKLLRIDVEHDGSTITRATITGDFFLYPEDGLGLLESGLVGTPIDESNKLLTMRIDALLQENRLTVLGFGPSDLAAVVREALG